MFVRCFPLAATDAVHASAYIRNRVGPLKGLIKKKKKNTLYVETYARYLLRKAWFSYATKAPAT